ncbi:hypothetical protein HG531_000253 [Fusarium graminearum]|nr:hypothetical protein HG531_000253 [Fusarium graminearum]
MRTYYRGPFPRQQSARTFLSGRLGQRLLELVTGHLVPGDLLESSVGALEHIFVNLLLGNDSALENVAEQEVVVHSLGDNLGGRGLGELDKGVVLAGTGLFVSRESQRNNGTELLKVLSHLVLVETVGDATDVDNAGVLVGGLGSLLNILGDLGDLANVLAGLEAGVALGHVLVAGIELLHDRLDLLALLSL